MRAFWGSAKKQNIFMQRENDLLGVTLWVIGLFLELVLAQSGFSRGLTIWPHSHLPDTIIAEYPSPLGDL